MEYYAKSRAFLMKQDKREEILRKLEAVIEIFYDRPENGILERLQKYKEELLTKKSDTAHKTLTEHLEDTVRCAQEFFDMYGSCFTEKEKMLILDACRLHDIGKANYIFQTIVNSELEKAERKDQIPHGFLSAVLLSQKKFVNDASPYSEEDFRILLTSIYYHHDREDIYDPAELKDYFDKFCLKYVKEYLGNDNVSIHTSNKNQLLFSNMKRTRYKIVPEDLWCRYMLVKGMLNRFDWTVSAGYDRAEIETDIREKRLCAGIEKKLSGNFRPAQEFMIESRDKNVVMIAPTGSGKTEAALMWINGEKGFYTLPLKVSSNAIYKRITENYGYEHTALLHSDSMNIYLDKTEDDLKAVYQNYEQAKLFSYPLTVCTVDQLFKFVYKALGTEIFAATLKYSKVVIDEIQSYSPRVVSALIYGLSEVRRMGGKFAIITATFPPVLKYFMKKTGLTEDSDYVFKDFSSDAAPVRHKIRIADGALDITEIADAACEKKVLVICNTVSQSQKVYKEITQELNERGRKVETGLLHSRFIRAHRDMLEKEIMDFSSDILRNGVWVTTQIVEASLDIDFDVLYTEMCTADSLLQRMGRCNRAGKKDTRDPNIIIFDSASGRGCVYDKDIYDISANLIKKYDGCLFSECDKTQYINEVYDIERVRTTKYFKQIEENLEHFSTIAPSEYDMKTANDDFRAIQSITVMPDIVYGENREKIERIGALLSASYVNKAVRKMLKSEIADMTLSLQPRNYSSYKKFIDKRCIGCFDIHGTELEYDFDGNKGLGLLLDKTEDENNFL